MTSEQPVVSVVIPVFNRAHVIEPTLNTVGEQTYRPLELIIVDDCSADSAALQAQIEAFKTRFTDVTVEYYRHEINQHGAAARNTGIKAANGKFIALLDSDDLWRQDKVAVAVEYLIAHPECPGIYSAFTRIVAGGQQREPDRGIEGTEPVADYLLYANQSMQTSSLVLRRSVMQNVLFDPELKRFQDFDFCIELDRKGYRLHYVNESLVTMTDQDSGNRISNSINLQPVEHWRKKMKSRISERAYAAFSINRLVRYQLLNGYKWQAAKLLFNPSLAWHCPARGYRQMFLLWLVPTACYSAIKNYLARRRGRAHR